uniref:G protein-coupled receptor n=1 Tax=Bursaphelenchus xylophilus TaxID=6326 RepID=A0A1I7RJR1_BURXY
MATPSSVTFHSAPTADNPFAWDIPDSNGNFPTSPYDELEVLNWYTSIHYAVTISVGAILVPCMIYMVLFHTTGALLPYKKLLLVCSMSDFFFWLLDSCGQLKVRMIDGVFVGTVTGPAKLLPRWGQLLAASLGVSLVCFTNATLPAQSFYRYYALTRGKTCDKLKTTLILAFPFVVNIVPFVLLYISFFESPKVRPGYNYATLWFKEYPLPLLLILDTRSSWDMAFIATAGLQITFGYLATVYFSYKTWRQLCVYADKYSPKTKVLQAQLARFLFFQISKSVYGASRPRKSTAKLSRNERISASSKETVCFICSGGRVVSALDFCARRGGFDPILTTSIVPASLLAASALLRIDGGISTTVSVTLASWIPILNSLLTITAIVPYRRVLKGWLCHVLHNAKILSTVPSTVVPVNSKNG